MAARRASSVRRRAAGPRPARRTSPWSAGGAGDPPRSGARGRRHDGHREVRRRVPRPNLEPWVDGGIDGQHGHAADEPPGRVRPHLDSASCRGHVGQLLAEQPRVAVSRTALAQAGRPRASTEPQEWSVPTRCPWRAQRRWSRRRCAIDAWQFSSPRQIGGSCDARGRISPAPGRGASAMRACFGARLAVRVAGERGQSVGVRAARASVEGHVRIAFARPAPASVRIVAYRPRRGLRSRLDYSASTSCPAFCAFALATILACWCDGTSS